MDAPPKSPINIGWAVQRSPEMSKAVKYLPEDADPRVLPLLMVAMIQRQPRPIVCDMATLAWVHAVTQAVAHPAYNGAFTFRYYTTRWDSAALIISPVDRETIASMVDEIKKFHSGWMRGDRLQSRVMVFRIATHANLRFEKRWFGHAQLLILQVGADGVRVQVFDPNGEKIVDPFLVWTLYLFHELLLLHKITKFNLTNVAAVSELMTAWAQAPQGIKHRTRVGPKVAGIHEAVEFLIHNNALFPNTTQFNKVDAMLRGAAPKKMLRTLMDLGLLSKKNLKKFFKKRLLT